jgi:hypothetical protein
MQVTDTTRGPWPLSVGFEIGLERTVTWLFALLLVCLGPRRAQAEVTGEVIITPPWWAKQAALSIDGRPAGKLPQKILLPPGEHRLVLQQGRALLPVDVTVKAGRSTLVHWPRLTAPEVTLSKAVGLLFEPSKVQPSLQQAVLAGIHGAQYVVLGEHGGVESGPVPMACGESAACLEEIATTNSLRFVLSVKLSTDDPAAPITLRIFDAETGDFALQQAIPLPEADFGKRLPPLLTQALQRAPLRPMGLIEISSQPIGAEVLVDGRRLGVTPYRRQAAVGEHDIVLHKTGFQDYLNTIDVQLGRGSALDAVLRPEPPPSPPPRPSATAKR